jgi:hypothetical protein
LNSAKTRRNLDIDHASDDADKQSRGRLGSGNEATGHPANNVIIRRRAPQGPAEGVHGDAGADNEQAAPAERGTKGSGNRPLSEAGRLADDRPGRNAAKGRH